MTTASTVKKRSIPGGKIYVDDLDSSENPTGEFYMGLTPGFTINLESEKIESFGAESGSLELDDDTVVKTTRTATVTCRQVSLDNLGRFIVGTLESVTQTSSPVSDEAHSVLPDRHYQLGVSLSNPTGVRGVGSVTVTAGDTAAAWQATTAYAVGYLVKKVSTPTRFARCKVAGTSDASEPTWPTTPGDTVVDGTVTWEDMGVLSPVADTDYTLDATLGRIYVMPGVVHPTQGTPWAVDYTPTAQTRDRVKSDNLRTLLVAFRFVSNPIKGDSLDIFAPRCVMAPNGDAVIKQADPAYVELSWELSFTLPGDGRSALYIDGRPA